jgi:hypothetical protein
MKSFSFKINLVFFVLPGDKPHACELCNKRFALACNLRAHMKTHEGKSRHFPLSHLAASCRGCRFKLSARRPPGTCCGPRTFCFAPLSCSLRGQRFINLIGSNLIGLQSLFRIFFIVWGVINQFPLGLHLVQHNFNWLPTKLDLIFNLDPRDCRLISEIYENFLQFFKLTNKLKLDYQQTLLFTAADQAIGRWMFMENS